MQHGVIEGTLGGISKVFFLFFSELKARRKRISSTYVPGKIQRLFNGFPEHFTTLIALKDKLSYYER